MVVVISSDFRAFNAAIKSAFDFDFGRLLSSMYCSTLPFVYSNARAATKMYKIYIYIGLLYVCIVYTLYSRNHDINIKMGKQRMREINKKNWVNIKKNVKKLLMPHTHTTRNEWRQKNQLLETHTRTLTQTTFTRALNKSIKFCVDFVYTHAIFAFEE